MNSYNNKKLKQNYSDKDKLQYYQTRVNDNSLSSSQREYALNRVNKLESALNVNTEKNLKSDDLDRNEYYKALTNFNVLKKKVEKLEELDQQRTNLTLKMVEVAMSESSSSEKDIANIEKNITKVEKEIIVQSKKINKLISSSNLSDYEMNY